MRKYLTTPKVKNKLVSLLSYILIIAVISLKIVLPFSYLKMRWKYKNYTCSISLYLLYSFILKDVFLTLKLRKVIIFFLYNISENHCAL